MTHKRETSAVEELGRMQASLGEHMFKVPEEPELLLNSGLVVPTAAWCKELHRSFYGILENVSATFKVDHEAGIAPLRDFFSETGRNSKWSKPRLTSKK